MLSIEKVRKFEKNKNGKQTQVFIAIHGSESHSEWFEAIAEELFLDGYDFISYNRAGSGKHPKKQTEYEELTTQQNKLLELITRFRKKYHKVHLLALSWGSLLAIRTVIERGEKVSSLHLVVPGIFPSKKLSGLDTLKVVSGFLFPNTLIKLPFWAKDFSENKSTIDLITNDKKNRTHYPSKFFTETINSITFLKTNKKKIDNTFCYLAAEDRIIRNDKTENYCKKRTIPFQYFSGGHAIVLEQPTALSNAIIQNIGQISK